MTPRRITVVLVGVFIVICTWMYLRDRPSDATASERGRAQLAADRILGLVAPSRTCEGQCVATVLNVTGPSTWRVEIAGPSWERCFSVDLREFSASQDRGLSGIRTATCEE